MSLGGTSAEYDRLFGKQQTADISDPFGPGYLDSVGKGALIDAYKTMAVQLRYRMQRPQASPKQMERDYLQLIRTKSKIRELEEA